MPTRKAVKTKISSSLFKFRRIFKPIFHSARLFFASCHEANGILCPFFISSCMTSASFIACNVSSLQVSKRTSNGNPPACMDFRRKTLIAVVKLRPRALYRDSLCFFYIGVHSYTESRRHRHRYYISRTRLYIRPNVEF